MGERVSISEFARRVKLNQSSISRKVQAGIIPIGEDRLIDLDEGKECLLTRQQRTRGGVDDPRYGKAIVRNFGNAKTKPIPGSSGYLTYSEARTKNESLKAQLREIELAKEEGRLVDKAAASALIFETARRERDVWLGWPARVAAIMASELGVGSHEMQKALDRHVREHLSSLAEVRLEFR